MLSQLSYGSPLAPKVGLEPTTYRLTAGCSAVELLRITIGYDLLSQDPAV